MTDPVRVLAAVISREGRFLLGLRPAAKRHGGCWEFPGGKVEPGETDEQALARELREELGVELVRVGRAYGMRHDGEHPGGGSAFAIVFVHAEVLGEPVALEHAALAWVHPTDFAHYPMAGADRWCAERLVDAPRDASPDAPVR